MSAAVGCNTCGKESYIECAPELNGPYMRLPATVSSSRDVTEQSGPVACNEKTGFVEQETCEGTVTNNWTIAGEQCNEDPICSYLTRGDCKFFRVNHNPYDGTNFWAFQARVGAMTGVNYDKNTTVGWGFGLKVQGAETKPAIF